MGARWDEHDERAFVRQAGVRPRLSLGDYRLKLCGASAQTVRVCEVVRPGLPLSAQHFWCGRAVFQLTEVVCTARRFPAKTLRARAHASQRQQPADARGLCRPALAYIGRDRRPPSSAPFCLLFSPCRGVLADRAAAHADDDNDRRR